MGMFQKRDTYYATGLRNYRNSELLQATFETKKKIASLQMYIFRMSENEHSEGHNMYH